MKRTLVAAILGIAAVANTYGQGHLFIGNYLAPPYNQVFWQANNQAVLDSGVQIQIWFAEGNIADPNLLTLGLTTTMNTSGQNTTYDPGLGHGPGGYFVPVIQTLPTWQAGDIFTFQLRAIGTSTTGPQLGPVATGVSWSALWTQQSEIGSSALPANNASFVPGLAVVVPEPSTFALAGLGSAALLIFRRRRA